MSFTNTLAPRPEFVQIPARVLEEASTNVPADRRSLRDVLSPAARKQRQTARKYDIVYQYKRLQRQAKADKRKEAIRVGLRLESFKRLRSGLARNVFKYRKMRGGEDDGPGGREHAEVLSVRHSTCSEQFLDSLIPLHVARTRVDIVRRPELFELLEECGGGVSVSGRQLREYRYSSLKNGG